MGDVAGCRVTFPALSLSLCMQHGVDSSHTMLTQYLELPAVFLYDATNEEVFLWKGRSAHYYRYVDIVFDTTPGLYLHHVNNHEDD